MELFNKVENLMILKLKEKDYFDSKFYYENKVTLKTYVTDAVIENEKPKGMYIPVLNIITIAKNYLNEHYICHEMLHMMAANRNKNITGYRINDERFKAFNEAATEWLTLNLLNLPLEEANEAYKKIVYMFDELVNIYSEDKMFSYYFKCDIKSFMLQFDPEDQKFILEKIYEMHRVLESTLKASRGKTKSKN